MHSYTLTWFWRVFNGSRERDSLHEVCPPLLRNGKESRVIWLVLIEVGHYNAHKQLQEEINSEEDVDV